MFFRRDATGDDAWLMEKIWAFTLGALLALAGMLLDRPWLIAVGALLLAGGIALRFVPRRRDRD